jgi:hypothetical protein
MYLTRMGWIRDQVDQKIADYLFNIKINLPERVGIYQRNIIPDLEIDFENLEVQLAECQEQICFFDMLLAEQKAVVALLEQHLRQEKGRITETLVSGAKDIKVEIRRTDIKDIIENDASVVDKQAKIIIETRNEDKLKAVLNGLQKKSDHLRSLAGFKRDEQRNTTA